MCAMFIRHVNVIFCYQEIFVCHALKLYCGVSGTFPNIYNTQLSLQFSLFMGVNMSAMHRCMYVLFDHSLCNFHFTEMKIKLEINGQQVEEATFYKWKLRRN